MTDSDRALLRQAIAALQRPLRELQSIAAQLRRIQAARPEPIGRLLADPMSAPASDAPLQIVASSGAVGRRPPSVEARGRRRVHTEVSIRRDSARVRRWLDDLGMSHSDVGRAIGVTAQMIGHIVAGRNGMSAKIEAGFERLLQRGARRA